jgi:hypothetical protein
MTSGTFVDSPTFFTHYSAVADIGTFALLFKLLGGQCVGGCEIDEPTAQIFTKECPLADVGRDFRTLDIASLPRCDILGSGAPCSLPNLLDRRPQGWWGWQGHAHVRAARVPPAASSAARCTFRAGPEFPASAEGQIVQAVRRSPD